MAKDLLLYIREGRPMTQREKLYLIVQLSIPSILAQISSTVMFLIDASMVGHLGEKAMASIGLIETTTWLMGSLASAANLGFSVQVAHYIGANDFEGARRVLRQSLLCCFIYGLVIALAGVVIHPFLPYWLGGNTDIAGDASMYFLIVSIGGIFFRFLSGFLHFLRRGNRLCAGRLGFSAACVFFLCRSSNRGHSGLHRSR